MSYDCYKSLPPADKELVEKYVNSIKSQGIFDQFRKDCQADVDTKPAYQNLQQRVKNTVSKFLSSYKWQENLNKTTIREKLRKHVQKDYLENGVDRIVDQVVNPKIYSVFMPKVGDIVYESLGVERPKIEPLVPSNILLSKRPSAPVEDVAESSKSQPLVQGTTDESKDRGATPEHVISDLPPHDDLEPVSPGGSLEDNMENSNTVTNDGAHIEPETPEKETKETNGEFAMDDDEDEEDASPAFEPIISNKDSKMSIGGLSEVSREEGSVFSNLNEGVKEKKFDNFCNLDEKIKQCDVNLTERKPENDQSTSSDSKTEDTEKDQPMKEETIEPVKVTSEDSTSSLGGSLKKHDSSSQRKSEASQNEKKVHDNHRDSKDKSKSTRGSSRHHSSSSRHQSSSRDKKDDHKSSRTSSSKDKKEEGKDDREEDKREDKKEDKTEDKKNEKKVEKREKKEDRNVERKEDKKDDCKEDRRDKKDDKSSEKRKESVSKHSSRSHEKKSDSRPSSSSRSSDKKSQASSDKPKENKDKEDEERKREAKKRKGERCDDVKSKNPRRSSDRDNDGGQGSSKSSKPSSSSSSSRKPSTKNDKTEGTKEKSNGGEDQQHDEEQPSGKPDEVDLILMQINSQIEKDEQQMVNSKKPKIANNFKEMKKVMKARKMLEDSKRVSQTEENKENDDSENRPKQSDDDFKEKTLTEMAVVQKLTDKEISTEVQSVGCSLDTAETSKAMKSIPEPTEENSASSQSDLATTCSSQEPFLGFDIDNEGSDVETSPSRKLIEDIVLGKKECFISLPKIGTQSPSRTEGEPPAFERSGSVEKIRGSRTRKKKFESLPPVGAEEEKTIRTDAEHFKEESAKRKPQKTSSSEVKEEAKAQEPCEVTKSTKKQASAKNPKAKAEKKAITKVTLKVQATLKRMEKERLISETESVEEATHYISSSDKTAVSDITKRKSVELSDNEENLSSSQGVKTSKKQRKGANVETPNLDNSNNNGGSQDKNKMEQSKRSSQRYDNEDLYKPRPVLSHHNSRRSRASNSDASGSGGPEIPLPGLRQRNRTR